MQVAVVVVAIQVRREQEAVAVAVQVRVEVLIQVQEGVVQLIQAVVAVDLRVLREQVALVS